MPATFVVLFSTFSCCPQCSKKMPKVWPVFGLFEDDRVLDIPESGEEPLKIVSLKEFFIVATKSGNVLLNHKS